jgi:hypothetical protein
MKYLALILALITNLAFAETPEEINDRVNEQYWGTKNQCWHTAINKKVEFDQAGYLDHKIYIIRTGRSTKHALLCKDLCYDDLQGVTFGITPLEEVLMTYQLVSVVN